MTDLWRRFSVWSAIRTVGSVGIAAELLVGHRNEFAWVAPAVHNPTGVPAMKFLEELAIEC